ncbi:ashwin-like [Aricia agestis]|uniref:ashwin-like n=1 Tax=Aricia agestis TaxID=91739 RepID=UPI001C203152|nr:ashwin-like [Aricia agestis]
MAVPCEMLLHPELLTNEQLMSIIRERHLRVPNIEMMDRDILLDVFHQYCVPYGQRKYRDSGRGKVLNKVRDMSPEQMHKLDTINNNIVHNSSYQREVDRLKPPPDMLSCQIKRIKLDSKPNDVTDGNISKRKMSIDSDKAAETPPRKKERKLITWP